MRPVYSNSCASVDPQGNRLCIIFTSLMQIGLFYPIYSSLRKTDTSYQVVTPPSSPQRWLTFVPELSLLFASGLASSHNLFQPGTFGSEGSWWEFITIRLSELLYIVNWLADGEISISSRNSFEALLRVFGIRDIRGKKYRDTGYLRKKLLGYRILRSSFRDTGYSQKIVTYQMFDEKRSWITKYKPFSVFLLMISYKWKIYKCKTNRFWFSWPVISSSWALCGVTWSTKNSAPALNRGETSVMRGSKSFMMLRRVFIKSTATMFLKKL